MSLLDYTNETVYVYPEEVFTDSDGNTITKASDTPFKARAFIQVAAASGTSARRAEQDNEGFESEQDVRIQFPRSFKCAHGYLGAQTRIRWRDQLWSIVGDHFYYNGSGSTRHHDYRMRRT